MLQWASVLKFWHIHEQTIISNIFENSFCWFLTWTIEQKHLNEVMKFITVMQAIIIELFNRDSDLFPTNCRHKNFNKVKWIMIKFSQKKDFLRFSEDSFFAEEKSRKWLWVKWDHTQFFYKNMGEKKEKGCN